MNIIYVITLHNNKCNFVTSPLYVCVYVHMHQCLSVCIYADVDECMHEGRHA